MFSFKSKIILKAFQILQSKYIFTPFPMTPCMRLITCTGVSHHPDYLASTLHTLVAKSCFGTADISERFPLCVFLLTTWTVYSIWPFCCLPFGCTLCLPPAPTFCIDSVYESDLPTLLLILLIKLCLSDLFFVLIKLHMDLNITDPSLHICCQNYCQWQKIVIINIDDTNKL